MRIACTGLTVALLAWGCATAQLRPPKAIPDVEPEVTSHVSHLLGSLANTGLAPELLTDNLRAALGTEQQRKFGALLRPCGPSPTLELLQRTTRGEDRQYLYRIPCSATPLLLAIDFNKGARINRLDVRPEPR